MGVVTIEEWKKRRLIRLAQNSEQWQHIVGSFVLSGISLTEEDAVVAGRLLSGAATLEQIKEEIKVRYTRSDS